MEGKGGRHMSAFKRIGVGMPGNGLGEGFLFRRGVVVVCWWAKALDGRRNGALVWSGLWASLAGLLLWGFISGCWCFGIGSFGEPEAWDEGMWCLYTRTLQLEGVFKVHRCSKFSLALNTLYAGGLLEVVIIQISSSLPLPSLS